MFYGRARELEMLERAYDAPTSAFVPIYGRRRVGKSALILEFLRNRPAIYFVGKQAPAGPQIREFLGEAARALDEPLLAEINVESWAQALDLVVSRWKGPGKLVLALDEFQWMAEASPELPSLLQERWDRDWSGSDRVFLILCGSYIGFMEREVLGERSPLYGRRTGQILLKPFDYREAAQFHPDWSVTEIARVRFVCGGVPSYLLQFGSGSSVEESVRAKVLDSFGALRWEPEFLLREELRGVENYHAVLMALAGGAVTTKDIARVAGVPERSLYYYLQQLTALGYVAKRYPLSGRKPAARHVRYSVSDPLLRFWFRFVFPNQTLIERVGPERAFAERIRPALDAYFGLCFERLCREALADIYLRRGVRPDFEIGEFWSRDVQIDVVGHRTDGWTDLGECRWREIRSIPALEDELASKLRHYPNRRAATLGKLVFVKTKPDAVRARKPANGGVRWLDLEDLYGVS